MRVVGARKNKDRSTAYNGHLSTAHQAAVVKPRDSRTKADPHQPRPVTTSHRNQNRDDDGQPVAPHRAKKDGQERRSLSPSQQDSRRHHHHHSSDDDDEDTEDDVRGHRTMNNVLPRIDENDNVMSTADEANHSTDSESMTDKDEPTKPCKI